MKTVLYVALVATLLVWLPLSAATAQQAAPVAPSAAIEADGPDYRALSAEVPTDPDRAFNAGLAAAHEDDIGAALLYLERARAYAPLDREIRDTVTLVRREAGSRRADLWSSDRLTQGQPAALYWWHFFRSLPLMLVVYILLGASIMSVSLVVVRTRLRRGGRRDAATVFAVVGVLVCINAVIWIVASQRVASRIEPAVIVASNPTYRDAPDGLASSRRGPEVYTGALVLIRESRPGWLRIELADGDRVWVAEDTAQRVLAE